MSDYLPADLITGILLRLTIPALLRCRSVSRDWRALIDSPRFTKLQLEHSAAAAAKTAAFLICNGDYELFVAEYVNGLEPGINLDFASSLAAQTSGIDPGLFVTLLGSCNGLLCSAWDRGKVLITNPATRKSYVVPGKLTGKLLSFAVGYSSDDKRWVIYRSGYGFGYDSVSDDYKVVEITQMLDSHDNAIQSELITYGVRSNSRVAMNFPYFLTGSHKIGVFVGGAIHWTGGRHGDRDRGIVIVGFDLGLNECREVPQPEYPNGKSFGMRIGELGKCLCIFANYKERFVDVWMMNEYGVKESWSILFTVPYPGLCYKDYAIRPLGFSVTGQEVLLQLDNKKLVWYDLKDPQNVAAAEEINIGGLKGRYIDAVVCYGSLVSPGPGRSPPKEEVEVDKGWTKKKRDDFLSTGFNLKL